MKEEPLTTPSDTHDSLTALLSRTAILKNKGGDLTCESYPS